MTTRTTARTAAILLSLVASLPGAAQAKTTLMSRVHEKVAPAPATYEPVAPARVACEPTLSPADLFAYIATRLEVVNAKIERLFAKVSGKDGTEADMIELMEAMSEHQTVLQLQKNTVHILLDPPGDMPDDPPNLARAGQRVTLLQSRPTIRAAVMNLFSRANPARSVSPSAR